MRFKLLTEHHLEFLSLKEAAEARLSLQLSKCHTVGNLMHRLKWFSFNNKMATKANQSTESTDADGCI